MTQGFLSCSSHLLLRRKFLLSLNTACLLCSKLSVSRVPAQALVGLVINKTGSQQSWRPLQRPVVQPLAAVARLPKSLRILWPSLISTGASTRSTWCSRWLSRAASWRCISSRSNRRSKSSISSSR